MNKEEIQSQDDINSGDIDWEKRILCRDGNCIGVIGANGRCKECGLAYDVSQGVNENFEPDDIAASETYDAAGDDAATDDDEDAAFIQDSDWEKRSLCSDGNCIGVIGPDDCCQECGKEHHGSVNNLSGAA